MKKALRWIGIGIGAIVGLLLVAALVLFVISEATLRERHTARAETLPAVDAALLADAPRRAMVLGCTNCHGDGLKGQVMADIPGVARMIAPNLATLAPRVSDQQLAAAIRQGIGHDGRPLFVMPSPQLSRLEDGEVAALIAWMRRLPARPGIDGKVTLGPGGRAALALGIVRSAPALVEEYRRQLPVPAGAEHEAGRHLAATACAECHGPALEGQDNPFGPAPDLRVAAGYDATQFATLLRRGTTPAGAKLGMMAEVAQKDFVELTDGEIAALHAYLDARAKKIGD